MVIHCSTNHVVQKRDTDVCCNCRSYVKAEQAFKCELSTVAVHSALQVGIYGISGRRFASVFNSKWMYCAYLVRFCRSQKVIYLINWSVHLVYSALRAKNGNAETLREEESDHEVTISDADSGYWKSLEFVGFRSIHLVEIWRTHIAIK